MYVLHRLKGESMGAKMRSILTIVGLLAAGRLQAAEIYTTSGFESYTNGTVANKVVGGVTWIEWDTPASVNNANPLLTQVQTNIFHDGAKALAIGDITNRVLARAVRAVTNAVTYWDAYYKSEATNSFGYAIITFRTLSFNKSFRLDGSNAWWESSLTNGAAVTYSNAVSRGKYAPTVLGRWDRVTVGFDRIAGTYAFYLNDTLAFKGNIGFAATQISSWEIDVTANVASRSPQDQYAFYVDDLAVLTKNPFRKLKLISIR